MNDPQIRHSRHGAGLQIRLLGTFALSIDAEPVPTLARKTRALLAYLVLRDAMSAPRAVLTGLLWGDRGEEQARASLRQALAELRRALAPIGDVVVANRELVSLDSSLLWCDAHDLENAASTAPSSAQQEVAALYRGELLEGMMLDEPDFDQWLAGERERFRLLASTVLANLMDRAAAAQNVKTEIGWALKLLSLDPLQEHVHRRLMQLYLAQNRRDAGLAQYEHCRRMLAEQLGVNPEPATDALAKELREARRGRVAAQGMQPIAADPARPSPPLPARPSIAVLRFRELGAPAEADYFAEGVAEDLITELARNKELFVIARHSSFAIDDSRADPAQIGRALGARYLLSGSVRRAGARMRLSVHLRESETGSEVWAEHYDRDLEDIFDLQSEIARTVSATAFGRIVEHDVAASRARRPSDLTAYDHVLRAMRHLQNYAVEDYTQARRCLEQAIAVDPGWARPYGYLCIIGVYTWFWDMSEDGLSDVLATAERTLTLDSHDARLHLALGIGHLFSRHHTRAIHHFERATSLNPNDDLTAVEHGRMLMYHDRPEDGLMRVREAMRLNPFHPNWYWNVYGRCLHTAGRYEEAIAAFNRLEATPFWVLAYQAACHAMIGAHDQAAVYVSRLELDRKDFGLRLFRTALPYRSDVTLKRFLDTFRAAGFRE